MTKSSKSSSFSLVRLLFIVRPQQLNKPSAAALAEDECSAELAVSSDNELVRCDILHGFLCIIKILHENAFIRHRHYFCEQRTGDLLRLEPMILTQQPLTDYCQLLHLVGLLVDVANYIYQYVLQSRVNHRFVIRPWRFKFRMKYCSCWCFSIIKYIM